MRGFHLLDECSGTPFHWGSSLREVFWVTFTDGGGGFLAISFDFGGNFGVTKVGICFSLLGIGIFMSFGDDSLQNSQFRDQKNFKKVGFTTQHFQKNTFWEEVKFRSFVFSTQKASVFLIWSHALNPPTSCFSFLSILSPATKRTVG